MIYLGSRRWQWDAEALCNQYIFDRLMRGPVVMTEADY